MKIITVTKTYNTKLVKALIIVVDAILLLAVGAAFFFDKEVGAAILLAALLLGYASYHILSLLVFKILCNGPIMKADVYGDFQPNDQTDTNKHDQDDHDTDNFDINREEQTHEE